MAGHTEGKDLKDHKDLKDCKGCTCPSSITQLPRPTCDYICAPPQVNLCTMLIEHFHLSYEQLQTTISGIKLVGSSLYIPIISNVDPTAWNYVVLKSVFVTVGCNPGKDFIMTRITNDIRAHYNKVAENKIGHLTEMVDILLS